MPVGLFSFAIALVMKSLQIWVISMVSPYTRHFLDINVYFSLAYLRISWMASSNKILIERLLSFDDELLEFVILLPFLKSLWV